MGSRKRRRERDALSRKHKRRSRSRSRSRSFSISKSRSRSPISAPPPPSLSSYSSNTNDRSRDDSDRRHHRKHKEHKDHKEHKERKRSSKHQSRDDDRKRSSDNRGSSKNDRDYHSDSEWSIMWFFVNYSNGITQISNLFSGSDVVEVPLPPPAPVISKRAKSSSPIPENGAGDVLSIEETNKLRAKLGLKSIQSHHHHRHHHRKKLKVIRSIKTNGANFITSQPVILQRKLRPKNCAKKRRSTMSTTGSNGVVKKRN